jgi:hypothetical protein
MDMIQSSKYLYVGKLITQIDKLSNPIRESAQLQKKIDLLKQQCDKNTGKRIADVGKTVIAQMTKTKSELDKIARDMFVMCYEFIMQTQHTDEQLHKLNVQFANGFSNKDMDACAILYHYLKGIFVSFDDIFDDDQKLYLQFIGMSESQIINEFDKSLNDSVMSDEDARTLIRNLSCDPEPKKGRPIDTNKMINNMSKKWLKTQIVDIYTDRYKAKNKYASQSDIDRYRNDIFVKLNSYTYVKMYQKYASLKYGKEYTDADVWKLIDKGVDPETQNK